MKKTFFKLLKVNYLLLIFLLFIPADVVPADVVPADVVPADVIPADVVPADVVPADVVPADVVPADVVPADVVPAGITKDKKTNSFLISSIILIIAGSGILIWGIVAKNPIILAIGLILFLAGCLIALIDLFKKIAKKRVKNA